MPPKIVLRRQPHGINGSANDTIGTTSLNSFGNVFTPSGGGNPILSASDFTLAATYELRVDFDAMHYNSAITHRYVNGDFRLIYGMYPWMKEISLTGVAPNVFSDISSTHTWILADEASNPVITEHFGCWYDTANNKLWTACSIDYGYGTFLQAQIINYTLNDNNTISNVHGPVGLQNIQSSATYGGYVPIPAWFQSAYGTGPIMLGFGGYTSLVAQSGASMGPMFIAIPGSTASYAYGTSIPSTDYKIMGDMRGGASAIDWYKNGGSGTTFRDRGRRLPGYHESYVDSDQGINPYLSPPGVFSEQIIPRVYNVNTNGTTVTLNNSSSVGIYSVLTTGTARDAGTTTITLALSASITDDIYTTGGGSGSYPLRGIKITAGTGAGQIRQITDYVGNTRVATVDTAWSTLPDTTSQYEVGEWAGVAVNSNSNLFWLGYTVLIGGVATPIAASNFPVIINGVPYTVASLDTGTQLTLTTSAGVQTNVNMQTHNGRPPHAPSDACTWQQPRPDGYASWTWIDTYNQNCVWIDGPNKQGIVALGAFVGGKIWYSGSNLAWDSICHEWHVYNPAHFGEVINGTRQAYDVVPTNMWHDPVLSSEASVFTTSLTVSRYSAMTYDPITKKLYVAGWALNGNSMRIKVYDVNC